MQLIRAILLSAVSLASAAAVSAETRNVHMGLTPQDFAAFAKRTGWIIATPVKPGDRSFSFRIPGGFKVWRRIGIVRFENCDKANRCTVAVIGTYYAPPPEPEPRQTAYNWNRRPDTNPFLSNLSSGTRRTSDRWHGGTRLACATRGYFMFLHQALYLRGVTDLYLKEMLGRVWARNNIGFSKYLQDVVRRTQRK